MAAPFGHAFVGMMVARRMGVRSRTGLIAAAFAASLPDIDIVAGKLLHNDPWKLHRQGTHTLEFALSAGAMAGLTGILAAEGVDGHRDLARDAMAGAAVVGSHIVLDRVPYPPLEVGPEILGMKLSSWILDAAFWGYVAYRLWPKGAPESTRQTQT